MGHFCSTGLYLLWFLQTLHRKMQQPENAYVSHQVGDKIRISAGDQKGQRGTIQDVTKSSLELRLESGEEGVGNYAQTIAPLRGICVLLHFNILTAALCY